MISRSVIARHPQYANIIARYREQFIAHGGKVNEKKFWEDFIAPVVPNYSLPAWYQFVEKFRKHAGLSASMVTAMVGVGPVTHEEGKLEQAMITNEAATQSGIQGALNIFSRVMKEIFSDPAASGMSRKEMVELGFKAMKAQDSRIHAIKTLKEDGREQAKFEKMFGGSAF